MNQLETKIFDEYKQWINSGNCQNCKNHDKELPSNRERIGPLSFFHIGNNFSEKTNPIRLCFVGKASWYTKKALKKEPFTHGVHDVSTFGEYAYENNTKAYWNFIRRITKDLNLSLDDIAITNLVKCHIYDNKTNTKKNITPTFYYEQCIKLFEKEIIAIQPTHMVLFTKWGYDYLLRDLTFEHSNFTDITDEDYKKSIDKEDGSFQTWWWYRNFSEGKMHMLRVQHPQGANIELKDAIVEWIKSTK